MDHAPLLAPLGGDFVASGDVMARTSGNQGRVYELEFGALLGFKASDAVTLSTGFSHRPEFRKSGDFVENRALQQVDVKLGRVLTANLAWRTRVEERWRSNASGTGVRLRERLMLTAPLGGRASPRLVLYHESFIGVTGNSFQLGGWNAMRNSVGLNFALLPRVRGEASYINQYSLARGKPDQQAHILSLALSSSF